ncbi:MAG: hypothetical protein J2P18_02710 [Nocardia sp.]|nr:hypothetical protein [Nocardia sp.]
MRELHPDVQMMNELRRELRHRIADVRERADAIFARRPSPSGNVIPEVDAMGRLRDLYLAPGTCDLFGCDELAAEIMAAITESTRDAQRQYQIAINDPANIPESIAQIGERRLSTSNSASITTAGKREQ